jgi:cellulose synthase/poly-beta-1,6-N-acetylglucosamine synthase-like glycosyltransferase
VSPSIARPVSETSLPSVSVVVPTYDEEPWIVDCLESLGLQDYAGIAEILVVDGRSRDATRDLVARRSSADGRIALLDNPGRSAAAAMNVGLDAARGDLLVRADAHARYAPDYVGRCVEVLTETGADDVGGPMRPVGTTRFGRAVAAVTSSRIGMGSGAFHWATDRRDVDTVYLGCYRTDALRELGGWDADGLQWAAEDHELNHRLRRTGGRIVCDPSIRSWYFPRDTPRALWRQYRNYGVGKVSTLAKHRTLPTLRPLAPAALVAGTAIGFGLAVGRGRAGALLPTAVWAGAVAVAGARMGRTPGVDGGRAVAALGICHLAYGVGFWSGVGRVLAGRGFDRLPAGSR